MNDTQAALSRNSRDLLGIVVTLTCVILFVGTVPPPAQGGECWCVEGGDWTTPRQNVAPCGDIELSRTPDYPSVEAEGVAICTMDSYPPQEGDVPYAMAKAAGYPLGDSRYSECDARAMVTNAKGRWRIQYNDDDCSMAPKATFEFTGTMMFSVFTQGDAWNDASSEGGSVASGSGSISFSAGDGKCTDQKASIGVAIEAQEAATKSAFIKFKIGLNDSGVEYGQEVTWTNLKWGYSKTFVQAIACTTQNFDPGDQCGEKTTYAILNAASTADITVRNNAWGSQVDLISYVRDFQVAVLEH